MSDGTGHLKKLHLLSTDDSRLIFDEAERQLRICNACRYCEAYCAVFPAVERRTLFSSGDITYLANLCHDCRACLQACMYTAPHDFDMDIPAVMSKVRETTYASYAWPRRAARFVRHLGIQAALIALGGVFVVIAMFLAGTLGGVLGIHVKPGAFYQVVPWLVMLIPALLASLFVVAVLIGGARTFWIDSAGATRAPMQLEVWRRAWMDVVRLRNLAGEDGCYYPDSQTPSQQRRVYHQLVFFGFLLDFISTCVAALYQDVLGQQPPYPLLSAPVVLGTLGGVGLVVGCTGLLWLKAVSDRGHIGRVMMRQDTAFLILLNLAAATGLALLALRSTPAMGSLLAAHLAVLFALYATLPYGKFVHWVYRYAALVKSRAEEVAERDRAEKLGESRIAPVAGGE